MSQKAKHGILVATLLTVFVGLGIYGAVTAYSRAAAAQALPDVGKFRVGSILGQERSGFTGRAMVQVFASTAATDWAAVSECLASQGVTAEMAQYFVGALIDDALEPDVEQVHRERDGLRVIVRGLGGGFLGALPAGFACQDLVDMLRSIRESATRGLIRSPLYENLLESTAPVDWLIERGERANAEKYVDFLEEFEGSASPAVQAANARLGR